MISYPQVQADKSPGERTIPLMKGPVEEKAFSKFLF
jgi:hypothetical protein